MNKTEHNTKQHFQTYRNPTSFEVPRKNKVANIEDCSNDLMETHSLEYIRLSLEHDQKNSLDLVSLLEKHHEFLRESAKYLQAPNVEPQLKQFHLSRLLHILNMHSKAQEETLFTNLIASDAQDARMEGFEGRYTSTLIFQLGYELYAMNFFKAWSEEIEVKTKILLSNVLNRIKQDEEKTFEIAENRLTRDELEYLASQYVAKCINYLDDELNMPQISLLDPSYVAH